MKKETNAFYILYNTLPEGASSDDLIMAETMEITDKDNLFDVVEKLKAERAVDAYICKSKQDAEKRKKQWNQFYHDEMSKNHEWLGMP